MINVTITFPNNVNYICACKENEIMNFVNKHCVKKPPLTKIKRSAYFAIIDSYVKDLEVGYTKYEWHELFKKHVLPTLTEHKDMLWEKGEVEDDTGALTAEGWDVYIQKIKDFVGTNV